jgi:putative hemolysin
VSSHGCGNPIITTNLFRVKMADTLEDLTDCQRLRYLVFNCELGEGLDSAASAGLDRDQFDSICDHLMVQDAATGKLVGTYRMQSGIRAMRNPGYYGEQLFDFGPFEPFQIAKYAVSSGARYLIGCSPLSTQDEDEGMALYEALRERYLVEPALRTKPAPGHDCKSKGSNTKLIRPPRLFRAYLEISARLCGPPAIDREFKTIDFLTLIDLRRLPDRVRTRFF